MIQHVAHKIFGSPNDRYVKKLQKTVAIINSYEQELQQLADEEFAEKTAALQARYQAGETLDTLLPYAFALVREASVRAIGMRHYDVQVLGAMALHKGHISQMGTGEGKTLVATMPAYLNALTGHAVHIVTVNDYLAARDAEWMGPVFTLLGMQAASVTSQSSGPARQEAYAQDVVYVTNTEVAFDFLRDNMVVKADDKVQGPLHFVIVDEVDSVLIDNARTPVVISGSVSQDVAIYHAMNQVAAALVLRTEEGQSGDFKLDEKHKQAYLTEAGHIRAEEVLHEHGLLAPGTGLYDIDNLSLIHYLMASLRAIHLLRKDIDYMVKDGQVVIIDEHSGRAVPGRRWGDGMHQAVESKEQVEVQQESQTLASITFQNFFRQYDKIAGMTGTATTEAQEFQDVYHLSVVVIPSNKSVTRQDLPDVVYMQRDRKIQAIVAEIIACHQRQQPILVGTVSIESSEEIAARLQAESVPHQVLNAKHHEQEAMIIAHAGRKGAVTIATNMAGRGTDIILGGNADLALEQCADDAERAACQQAWQVEHDEVLALGGLKIIGTERHESRRIDNQLRGRSGRQGDPGTTQFYLSLEDNLMRIFASDKVQDFMKKMGMQPDDTISAPMLNRAIENAQKKVEGHNYDARKQLVEFDNIANDQRTVIFTQRNELLDLASIAEVIQDMRETVVYRTVAEYAPQDSMVESWDVEAMKTVFQDEFGVTLPIEVWLESDTYNSTRLLADQVLSVLLEQYQVKIDKVGIEVMQEVEKTLMLQVIDMLWKEHLATMDHLRHGIHLRGYAQRNPLQEYKRESFEIFTTMLDNIKFETIKKLHLVELVPKEATAEPDNIRRNDPCPCGSGNKYKHCHGKLA